MFVLKGKRKKLPPQSVKCIFLGYGTDGQYGFRLWDPENQRLVRSSDVVFNENTICTNNVRPKSGKRVNFDLTPTNPEDHAEESRGSKQDLPRTTPEDYEGDTITDANLPVTSTIPASHETIPIHGLDAREQNDATTDCSRTSDQTHTGQPTDTADASEITTAPRRSGRVPAKWQSCMHAIWRACIAR